ncbi:MAG: alpha-galactosidase [Candidatus Latescibacterota bacterium]
MDRDPLRWTITLQTTSCQVILADDGTLVPGYWGPRSGPRLLDPPGWKESSSIGAPVREIPYRGGFVEMTPGLEVIFPDGTREMELRYAGYEMGELDGRSFIRFDMKDIHYPLTVSEYIRVNPEYDILEKWMVMKNNGREPITVERAYSGSVVLPRGDYDLLQLSGDWGREFYPRRTRLTPGIKSLFVRGMKSQQHAPFFLVRPSGDTDENRGPVWFGTVAWSGNWEIDCEVNRLELTQVSGGINFWDTHWILEGGARFETPVMMFGAGTDGANGASRRLHRFLLDRTLPPTARGNTAQVLYNSWYATEFSVNEQQQLELARMAKEMGVELFVMDDGWFKGRKDDRAGLGDWTPDPGKFPKGLAPLAQGVKGLGMDFGIWVEPEMVNPNSDLFRAHPDWALHTPNRTAHEGRRQLVLNFARDDVKKFTIDWLDRLLTESPIRFVKWDMNRQVSEAGWPEVPRERQRELRIRYIRNLYDIFRTVREKHPEVVFESCSSGGGRVDPGILSLADQVWTSDNTDPGDRLQIQYGYSHAFPARTMVNWVTDSEWHNKTTSLTFKFHVAMAGNLGVGGNLTKWSPEERSLAAKLIAQYKSIRHIVQLGDQYRLQNPFEGTRTALQFVTRDGKESVVFSFQTLETLPGATVSAGSPDCLLLHGLDPDGTYSVGELGSDAMEKVSGAALMLSGIPVRLQGNYASRIIVLRRDAK